MECVVECVVVVMVQRMDVCTLLDSELHHPSRRRLPAEWLADERLGGSGSFADLCDAIRGLGDASDRVLAALLDRGRHDPLAGKVILAALGPLAIARCGGERVMVDELLGELAIVIGEIWDGGLGASHRRIANRLLDRAMLACLTNVQKSGYFDFDV